MEKRSPKYYFTDKRAVTYLLWAVLTTSGFVLTHLRQERQINGLWFLIVVVGLGYMVYAMPLKERKMKAILLSWLLLISIGLAVSGISFNVNSLLEFTEHLGIFWLFVMATGYALNGLFDGPSTWYWIAATVNIATAFLIIFIHSLDSIQYLLAAAVSGWSLLMLWIFRSDQP